MKCDASDAQANADPNAYRSLLAVSEAIIAHHDLSVLFHELADRLHPVVSFDALSLVLHEAASNTMRIHVLETSEPIPHPLAIGSHRPPGNEAIHPL